MYDYYKERLSAERLQRVYAIAPPRVQQYLQAEILHVLDRIGSGQSVLELGCGYGRILPELSLKAGRIDGIDSSYANLILAKTFLQGVPCELVQMDAVRLGFHDATFNIVICVQNGISAFHVDRKELIRESVRVTKPGGKVLFSSYAEEFWPDRLEWFVLQSEAGLLGEIDFDKTRDGVIVCKDGFSASTVSPDEFTTLTSGLNLEAEILTVDHSSVFCEITV